MSTTAVYCVNIDYLLMRDKIILAEANRLRIRFNTYKPCYKMFSRWEFEKGNISFTRSKSHPFKYKLYLPFPLNHKTSKLTPSNAKFLLTTLWNEGVFDIRHCSKLLGKFSESSRKPFILFYHRSWPGARLHPSRLSTRFIHPCLLWGEKNAPTCINVVFNTTCITKKNYLHIIVQIYLRF